MFQCESFILSVFQKIFHTALIISYRIVLISMQTVYNLCEHVANVFICINLGKFSYVLAKTFH